MLLTRLYNTHNSVSLTKSHVEFAMMTIPIGSHCSMNGLMFTIETTERGVCISVWAFQRLLLHQTNVIKVHYQPVICFKSQKSCSYPHQH